jgi:hypothetical protein
MNSFKAKFVYLIIFLVLLGITFRSLITNLTTNLPDWYDYPYLVWIINTNLDKFISLNFSKMFDTNILYPNTNNLLLTDTLFTQTFLALPIRIFTTNPILIFNLVFLTTFILNYLTSFLLWSKLFKKDSLAFLGSLLTVFSPFLHAEWGHFQLQSYWLVLLTLYFLFKSSKTKSYKYLIVSGVFVTLQFLASVYLSVFLIIAIGLFFFTEAIINRQFLTPFRNLAVVLASFAVLASPVIVGYLNIDKQYQVQRNYGEYVFYSAHLSDYLFSQGIKSLVHTSNFISKWNSFNHHAIGGVALFPGFLLTIFSSLAIFKLKKKSTNINFSIHLDQTSLFFFFLIIVGFIFSLGPRMNFNGVYAEIPLPYHFLLKYIPLFEVIRAPSRWMFLIYLGLIFFSLKFLSQKITKTSTVFLLTALVFLEYLPINIQTHAENYLQGKDYVLESICSKEPQVVLEIPITHFDAGKSILEGLNYITKTILASTYHKCSLVNGYGSYDLPSIATLTNSLYEASTQRDTERFLSLLNSSQAQILVVNRDFLKNESKAKDLLVMIKRLETEGYLLNQENGVYKIRIPAQ